MPIQVISLGEVRAPRHTAARRNAIALHGMVLACRTLSKDPGQGIAVWNLAALFKSHATRKRDALFHSLAAIEFDVHGTILAANARFCDLMGYAASEIEGKHHSMFVAAEMA